MLSLELIASDRIEGAVCRRCGATTRLFATEDHPVLDNWSVLTFVCPSCDGVQAALAIPENEDRVHAR
jgi:hypothetical protein